MDGRCVGDVEQLDGPFIPDRQRRVRLQRVRSGPELPVVAELLLAVPVRVRGTSQLLPAATKVCVDGAPLAPIATGTPASGQFVVDMQSGR